MAKNLENIKKSINFRNIKRNVGYYLDGSGYFADIFIENKRIGTINGIDIKNKALKTQIIALLQKTELKEKSNNREELLNLFFFQIFKEKEN